MKNKLNDIINITFLLTISFIAIFPYVVMILSCFSTNASIKGNSFFLDLSISNFINNCQLLLKEKYFFTSLGNSFFVSTISSLGGVLVASMAGYAFTIYKNKRTDYLFLIAFYSMMIPTVAVLIPTFLIFKYLNLLDTYIALILSSVSLPFLIYLFKQNTRQFPIELIKAARIDGLSEVGVFFKVYIPSFLSVYIAAIMISFFNAWNAFLIPVVILQTQSKFTNAIFLNSLGSVWYADYAVMMLALLVSTLPTIILFVIFQHHIKNSFAGIN